MSLGSMITQARKSAGLSIDDLSASTNIRSSLLREMESDSFHNCGGETYARGHIRNIATKLGVDPLIFIAAFEEEQMHADRSMKDLLVENSVMKLPEEARKISWKVLATISVSSLFVVGLAQSPLAMLDLHLQKLLTVLLFQARQIQTCVHLHHATSACTPLNEPSQ